MEPHAPQPATRSFRCIPSPSRARRNPPGGDYAICWCFACGDSIAEHAYAAGRFQREREGNPHGCWQVRSWTVAGCRAVRQLQLHLHERLDLHFARHREQRTASKSERRGRVSQGAVGIAQAYRSLRPFSEPVFVNETSLAPLCPSFLFASSPGRAEASRAWASRLATKFESTAIARARRGQPSRRSK